MEMSGVIVCINLDGLIEVFDCVLVITHVLVDKTALDVVRKVVRHQFLHFSKLLEGLGEASLAAEHEAEMKHRSSERVAILDGILEECDSVVNLLLYQQWVVVGLLYDLFCLVLEAQALAVIVLGISIFSLDRLFKIVMSLDKHLLKLIHVRTVKVVFGILGVQFNSFVVVYHGLLTGPHILVIV